MDEKPTPKKSAKDFNSLDLSQLESFSFGTQWSETPKPSGPSGSPRREGRDNREPRPARPAQDRRGFKRPQGGAGAGAPAGPAGGAAPDGGRRFAPRAGGPGPGDRGPGFQGDRGPRRNFSRDRAAPIDRGPYISPYFDITFYPEDESFSALVKTVRSSCRTIELFEIARTVIGKNDRFVVVVQRRQQPGGTAPGPLYVSLPDSLPFETEDEVIDHVMANHLGTFFDMAEVEVEAPKGSFQVINKCGVTGELLGPPNYHRYNQIVQQHYAAKISGMPLEAFKNRIVSVRDEESIAAWLDQMKKVTRYTWKEGAMNEGEPVPVFDSLEDARVHLLTHARAKIVRAFESPRFHGGKLESLPDSEIAMAVKGALEKQVRFPLDTANGLRGRLRREGFTIFKKGSKGVSYVCAVKRKFRRPGQTFANTIGDLITFIEAHPMVKASELPEKMLNVTLPEKPAPVAEGEEAAATPGLSAENSQKIKRMQGDLRWLVMEGYVTEFIDGSLFAAPPLPAPKATSTKSSPADSDADEDADDQNDYPEAVKPADKAPVPEPAPIPAPAPVPEAEAEATPVAPAPEPAPVSVPEAEAPGAEIAAEPAVTTEPVAPEQVMADVPATVAPEPEKIPEPAPDPVAETEAPVAPEPAVVEPAAEPESAATDVSAPVAPEEEPADPTETPEKPKSES